MSIRELANYLRTIAAGLSCRPRAIAMPVLFMALGCVPLSVRVAEAQANSDWYSYSKDLKSLDWDWYTKSFQDLTFNRMPGLSPDYQLGPGDELQILIVGFQGPFNFRIRAGGDVTIPLVGNVSVAGKTAEEAEEVIAAELRDRQLVTDPQVLIFIASYEAKKFYVYGQIDRPGVYTMSQQLTVMDAIFIAGGLDFYGDRYGFVHRRQSATAPASRESVLSDPEKAGPGMEVITLDLEDMRNGGVLSPNFPIEDGDVIVIPTRYPMVFYVLGDVERPGVFSLNNGERVTLSQALARAGGPTRSARPKQGMVVRYGEDGIRKDLTIDYEAIMKGEQRDLEIASADIIYIPGSSRPALGAGALNLLPILLFPFVR
jgi:polysaccharide biosynthesis/export protein